MFSAISECVPGSTLAHVQAMIVLTVASKRRPETATARRSQGKVQRTILHLGRKEHAMPLSSETLAVLLPTIINSMAMGGWPCD